MDIRVRTGARAAVARVIGALVTCGSIAACSGSRELPQRAGESWAVVPPSRQASAAAVPARRVEVADAVSALARMTVQQVQVEDPVYKRTKRYEGYPLADVLRAAFG